MGRDGRLATVVPDVMFSNIIRTVGAGMEEYVPAGPIQVNIAKDEEGGVIEWSVPVPSSFLPAEGGREVLPCGDGSFLDDDDFSYDSDMYEIKDRPSLVLQEKRLFATIKFGGSAQDSGIGAARKKLYDAVIKDGYEVETDSSGRPVFFFLQNNAKSCWTSKGMGMVLYEWRPDFMQTNEVGVELMRR